MNDVLRTEGFAVFATAVAAYFLFGFGWSLFLLFILVPDVFMVGYLKDNAWGAALYNLGHTYVSPLLLLGASYALHWAAGYWVVLIWVAHIGLDRALGYGLKHTTGFKDTHLGRIGR